MVIVSGPFECVMSVVSSDVWQGCTASNFRVTDLVQVDVYRWVGIIHMCQLYRKVRVSLSNHSNGQEDAERTCLFSPLHSWVGLLAQDQVLSPLPASVAVIAHMSSKLPTFMSFFPPNHFRIQLYPFIHPEDGCSTFLQNTRKNSGHCNCKHPSHEQLLWKPENLIVISLLRVKFQ
jgi:hypothetical protein